MKKVILTALIAATLAACAPQEALINPTESGWPQASYPDQTPADLRDKLVANCVVKGAEIEEASDSQVQCAKTIDSVMMQVAMSGSYGTKPQYKVRFVIYEQQDVTKVVARMWIESQNGFGQVRKVDSTNNADHNSIQRLLDGFGS